MAGVETFDLTAPVRPRPGEQSEAPTPGVAAEMPIDKREAPVVRTANSSSEKNVAEERPEPERLEMEDGPEEDVVPIVTPMLTREQVMDMCTSARRQDLMATEL